jgi:putative membrane protein
VQGGRVAIALVVVILLAAGHRQNGDGTRIVVDLVIVAVVILLGVIRWLVTRWSFDGATLRIETGLIRRDARQLPVTRIQAVDVVQPALAKMFGLAELRIRMAGGGKESRLSYLVASHAQSVRAALLATHHGLDASTPEPQAVPIAQVPTARLAGSVLFSGPMLILLAVFAGLSSEAAVAPRAAGATLAAALAYLLALMTVVWRRFNQQYEFTVGSAPDGIRIRRGLLGTTSETVPIRRVQAVRQVEPLLWRMFGWCRLEVDLAGVPAREGASGSRHVTKTLLPVGGLGEATALRTAVIGSVGLEPTAPPRRAIAKAPLSYHFLRAGHDALLAVSVTGRLRRVTCWVPLEKAQSVRRVQGPLQRRLQLATVTVDAAGRDVGARFKDRDVAEAEHLVEDLTDLCRLARTQAPREHALLRAPVGGGPRAAAGWFADPTGRHGGRYWDGGQWTEHVDDGGIAGVDPL